MPGFYIYLISSLPMLHFGIKPPFSFARFIEICKDKIPDADLEFIKVIVEGDIYKGAQTTLKQWTAFDIALRNELVKIRASRKHLDSLKYIRGDGYVEPYIAHIAINAYRTPSLLETEKILDEARWRMLDELTTGHFFDLDFLIAYALKLLILERWQRINSIDKPKLLEEALN
jgi:hypothetical protein